MNEELIKVIKKRDYWENQYWEMSKIGYSEEDEYMHKVCQKIAKCDKDIRRIKKEMI